ncbi:hypothetical protein BaRGS_00003067 [Batillaria attramentaria]|uniref:Uncharacterized protein n=1 Tax=Batillaria attramentaria TaxID=370345 RepID=A0ABD0M245_9CAEN
MLLKHDSDERGAGGQKWAAGTEWADEYDAGTRSVSARCTWASSGKELFLETHLFLFAPVVGWSLKSKFALETVQRERFCFARLEVYASFCSIKAAGVTYK